MKVLFVSSGNSLTGISPIVYNQGESLKELGLEIDYFTIVGRGFWGYLRNLCRLRNTILKGDYKIIHSHYSYSAILSTLAALRKTHCVSLMGSDTRSSFLYRWLIIFFSNYFWSVTILKSLDMNKQLNLKDYIILPNGVNLKIFVPLDRTSSCNRVGFNPNNLHITFFSDPNRPEKNFTLANHSIELIKAMYKIDFHVLFNIGSNLIPFYLNATDILISTSSSEGSPNVIKEAMACNCPIVSTNVGDVEWVLGTTDGCYLSSFDISDFTEEIKKAIEYSFLHGRTKGRERIIELGLDSETIAKKIIKVYKKILRDI